MSTKRKATETSMPAAKRGKSGGFAKASSLTAQSAKASSLTAQSAKASSLTAQSESPAPTIASASTTAGATAAASTSAQKDEHGDVYFNLKADGTRRVTINQFNQKWQVNVREYYADKDTGALKPGKKGLSLTIDQFNNLIQALPEIESALRDVGEEVVRPDYDGDAEFEAERDRIMKNMPEGGKAIMRNLANMFEKEFGYEETGKEKGNHEATSDEESEESESTS